MTRRRDAIQALKTAEEALAANHDTEETPEYRRLNAAVEAAYINPDLPDRYRDPRDRKNAHKLHCKCRAPRLDQDSYCLDCGCPTA
jgi:hypothetical protein